MKMQTPQYAPPQPMPNRPTLPSMQPMQRTPEQRKQEWRQILLIAGATIAGLAVLAQCALDIAFAGHLGGN